MIWLLLACTEKTNDSAVDIFNDGPTLVLDVTTERPIEGNPLSIQVQASDDDGIAQIIGYYRELESGYWNQILLWEGSDSAVSQDLALEIPVTWEPGTEVYIKATDAASPSASSFYPERGPDEPLLVTVFPESLPLPFTEDFEGGELLSLNWWSPSEGRDSFAFFRNASNGHNEGASAYHPAGSAGIDEVRDWLISPPLDFSGQTGVMVGWWEDVRSATEESSHTLWISTDQRLPELGTYIEVESLDVPFESGWRRYRYIDLTPWAGEPLVYLGWKWVGTLADEWYIDDIEVRTLGPDLDISLEPQVDPIEVTVPFPAMLRLKNHTNAPASNVAVAISFPDGGASYNGDPIVISSIDALGEAELEVSIDLDADLAPNRYLSAVLEATSDTETWMEETTLTIGYPSFAKLSVSTDSASFLQVDVGVGDPENPDWSTAAYVVVEGTQDVEVDITDAYMYLPPAAGDRRWFMTLQSDSLITAENIHISYGNESFSNPFATSVPLFADIPETYLIPPPPEPVLSSSPGSASPGESFPLSLTLYNAGNATQGAVYANVTALSSGVMVQDGTNILLDADIWNNFEFKTLSGPTLLISEDHVSSQPVSLEITLSDDVESWAIPFEVSVPFPVLKVIGAQILDDDGLLSPDESVQLELTIANMGDLNAFGPVTGELSVVSSSSNVTVTNDNPSFGFVNAGASKSDDDFTLSVEGGSLGDSIVLQLECTDTENTYTDQFELVLGEAPWYSLTSIPDVAGDVEGDSTIDLYSVDVRSFDGRFEMRIESATEIDTQIAFLEAWGSSGGADYTYYRWVMQSGIGTLQGYNSGAGFQPLGDLDVSFPDSYHVVLAWDIADMGLSQDQFSIGFASGWCGPPKYYCDQFPDAWGYPYESFNPSLWFDISF